MRAQSSHGRTFFYQPRKEDRVLNCQGLSNRRSKTAVLEETLESPLDCKEIQPVHPEGNQPNYSLEGLTLKLKLQSFGHLMQGVNSTEKTLIVGKIEGRKRKG